MNAVLHGLGAYALLVGDGQRTAGQLGRHLQRDQHVIDEGGRPRLQVGMVWRGGRAAPVGLTRVRAHGISSDWKDMDAGQRI